MTFEDINRYLSAARHERYQEFLEAQDILESAVLRGLSINDLEMQNDIRLVETTRGAYLAIEHLMGDLRLMEKTIFNQEEE